MYKLLVICIATFLLVGLVIAQEEWEYEKLIINGYTVASDEGEAAVNLPGFKNPYAVTVDPDGKVWAGTYYSRRLEGTAGLPDLERYPDLWYTIVEKDTGTGAYLDTTEVWNNPIWVWDPADGSIDTLRFLTLPDQSVDTLTSGHRGMRTDHEGNVIVSFSNGDVYKINYLTHDVILKAHPADGGGRHGVDAEGFVYAMDGVFATTVSVLDPSDFSTYNTITGINASVTRGLEVSPDGKNVYICAWNGGVHRYYSADGVDGTYALMDTSMAQYDSMTFITNLAQWHPSGLLWMGSYDDIAPRRMFAVDPDQDYALVDSLLEIEFWGNTDLTDTTSGGYNAPSYMRAVRDAEFSPDGKYLYTADFYSYSVKRWAFVPATSIQPGEDSKVVPGTFTLYHNYPNPFNPTTVIPFDLHKQAHVRLKVYDAVGREIGTFIDGIMKAGSHNYEFDGSNLASGTYYFKITVDTKVATGRMTLVK